MAARPKIVPDVVRDQILVALPPDASAREAAEIMAAKRIGAVMVVEHDRLVGIFTERDVIARVVAKGRDAGDTKLREAMTPDPDTLAPHDEARDALDLMVRKGYRHLPVVDGENRPLAMVSIRDLYGLVVDRLEHGIVKMAEKLMLG
jgi:CBS domain-containing protein